MLRGIFLFGIGGLVGVMIGWILKFSKKRLSNGEEMYNYQEADRKQGGIIFYLGIVFTFVWIYIKVKYVGY
jgi:hypothetical protein